MDDFDLKVGDIIWAEDTVSGGKHKWKVTFISLKVFEAERLDGKVGTRGFRKLDYMLGFISKV